MSGHIGHDRGFVEPCFGLCLRPLRTYVFDHLSLERFNFGLQFLKQLTLSFVDGLKAQFNFCFHLRLVLKPLVFIRFMIDDFLHVLDTVFKAILQVQTL